MKKEKMKFVGSLALVGLIGAGATLAYLTDNTGTITNTFTAGNNINIRISEKKLNGVSDERIIVDGTNEQETQPYENLLPGEHKDKDPRVDFDRDSNDGYAYLYVSGVNALKNADLDGNPSPQDSTQDFVVKKGSYDSYVFNDNGTGWFKIANLDGTSEPLGNSVDGIYVYKENNKNKVFKGGNSTPSLFDEVYIADDVNGVTESGKSLINNTHIVLKAAAVQPDDASADDTAIKLLKDKQ